MKISVPELSLVLLVGPSGSGKSSFARKHFLPTEVVSSDFCRALVADNENDQSATSDAFDLLHEIVRKRLARGRLTVVDATNVQPEARKSLIALAKEFHLLLRPSSSIFRSASARIAMCFARTGSSGHTSFATSLSRCAVSLRGLEREGIRHVFKLSSPEDVDAVTIDRQPLWNNRKTMMAGLAASQGITGSASGLSTTASVSLTILVVAVLRSALCNISCASS